MIRIPPIKILTPPIKLPSLLAQKPDKPARPGSGKPTVGTSPAKPTAGTPAKPVTGTPAKPVTGTPAKPASGTPAKPAAASAEQTTAEPGLTFETLFEEVLSRYLPETVAYTPIGEDVLRETIRNWIRPAYEQAIQNRRDRTERQNAELDADALARGMGASTYVTDVKERAYRSESRDVSDLESDYASTLAEHLYDAVRAQQEQKVAVDEFNAEQINRAREKAAAAAQALYNTYLANAMNAQPTYSGYGGGSESEDSGSGVAPSKYGPLLDSILATMTPENSGAQSGATVDYTTAANLLSRLSPGERAKLYAGEGKYARQNAELLGGLGRPVFEQLQRLFPAA